MQSVVCKAALVPLFLVAPCGWANDFFVNCDAAPAQTIQAAVDAAKGVSPHGPHTIHVTGDCQEKSVIVNGMDDLTIRSDDPAAPATLTLIAGLPDVPTGRNNLSVRNSHGFRLENMTVVGFSDDDPTNGRAHAVLMERSDGTLDRCTIRGAESNGINISNNSFFAVNNSTVEHNETAGITAGNQTSLSLFNTTVQDNGGNGIGVGGLSSLNLGSTSDIEKRVIVANNGGAGISIGNESTLNGGQAEIHSNGGRGINVSDSQMNLGGSQNVPLEIYNNGGQGVFLVSASGSLNNAEIHDNNQGPPPLFVGAFPPPGVVRCGVCLYNGTDLFLSRTEITSEPGHGLFMGVNSSAAAVGITVSGNSGDGVRIETASGIQIQSVGTGGSPPPPTTITGNGGFPLHCVDTDLSWVNGEVKDIKVQGCKILKPTL